jgi:hypothetical protein
MTRRHAAGPPVLCRAGYAARCELPLAWPTVGLDHRAAGHSQRRCAVCSPSQVPRQAGRQAGAPSGYRRPAVPVPTQVLTQLQSVCDIHAPRVIEEFIADKQLKDKSRRVPNPARPAVSTLVPTPPRPTPPRPVPPRPPTASIRGRIRANTCEYEHLHAHALGCEEERGSACSYGRLSALAGVSPHARTHGVETFRSP